MIEAAIVNHNTADYAELELRSLFALNDDVALSVTLLDNASTEERGELLDFARARDISVEQTGFAIDAGRNTHGENLTRDMLDGGSAEYFLLMDSDICFIEPSTISKMIGLLDADAGLWAVQAKMLLFASLLDENWRPRPGPEMFWRLVLRFGEDFDEVALEEAFRGVRSSYHGEIQERPHPFCLLVRNSPTLQAVLREVGFSTAFVNADLPLGGWYDTAALATRVMRTHGVRWSIAESPPVLHYAWVSERQETPELVKAKRADCRRRLSEFRARS